MKKTASIFFVSILLLSLSACSQPASSTPPPPPPASSSSSSLPASSASVSSKSQAPVKNLAQGGSIEGVWQVQTISFEGMTFTASELETALSQAASLTGSGMANQEGALELVQTLTITIQPEGEGELSCTINGEEANMPFNWEGQNGRYTFTDSTGDTSPLLHYEDDTLSYTYGSFELTLEKT